MGTAGQVESERAATGEAFSHQFQWELRLVIGRELVQYRVCERSQKALRRLFSGSRRRGFHSGCLEARPYSLRDHDQSGSRTGTNTVPNLTQPFTLIHTNGSAVNHEYRSIAVLKPEKYLAKPLRQLGCMPPLAKPLYFDPN